MRQWAQDEIILPTGPHAGRKLKIERNPFAGLLLDEFHNGPWRKYIVTGPTQSGKTLLGFVIPICYHLFEMQETVIAAAPSEATCADKWYQDILPVIESSRYRDQLPLSGRGSKKSKVQAITFRNGRTLRWMTGGGDDKSRASFTSRVVCITETDGLDQAASTSREADPIEQLIHRTDAFGARARIYMECTVSTDTGRTWREYQAGSASRIEIRCPDCSQWVCPERPHLQGWQLAENIMDAGARTGLACPACGSLWDEKKRFAANRVCRLVHHPERKTDTLGFRWTAANNLLVELSEIGKQEWKCQREEDENQEKALRQFRWALPVEPDKIDLSVTDYGLVIARQVPVNRGLIPTDGKYEFLTLGVDVQKHLCYWVAMAWREDRSGHVLDYGHVEVAVNDLGQERGHLAALRDFRDRIAATGWNDRKPVRIFIDAGNWQDTVTAFTAESQPLCWACKGFGESQVRHSRLLEDQGWEPVRLANGTVLVELLADRWKSKVHEALAVPIGKAGALSLFKAEKNQEHLSYAKHLTAEKKIEQFVAGKGMRTKWVLEGKKPNHFLDATALAMAAAETVWADEQKAREKSSEAPKLINDRNSETRSPTDYRGKW